MKLPTLEEQYKSLGDISISAFGAELLRQIVLPELLGKETANILYWAGKSLARRYPLETVSDIITFFEKAGWGTLSIVEEHKDELHVELSGDIIVARFTLHEHCTFQLEAGFLAQQIEQQKRLVTEAFEQQKRRENKALIIIKWDRKQKIE
ncbi:YslB family protein [Parageobacillus sp. VR-IP]|uniref:YslB family protein n=1 Tax=Parageobacillus sp. VR-IP TaxID=2742205 RepID=UPI00158296B2|nr:YslB family protein [Parageobacillus sp. VR-IP]NUK30729.1 YslB family protein [Parageobacillus sp. VR-IP]